MNISIFTYLYIISCLHICCFLQTGFPISVFIAVFWRKSHFFCYFRQVAYLNLAEM